jgi:hypothetical protein
LFLKSKIVSDLQKQVLKLQKKIALKNMETAKNKAEQQEGMINVLQKKPVVTNVQRKAVPSGRIGGKAAPKDLDATSSGDDDESSDEDDDDAVQEAETDSDDDDMDVVVKDFRWKSVEKTKGYLIVRFNDAEMDQKMDLRPLLHDYPEQVVRFMWEKYSQSVHAMNYVEACARGEISLGGKKKPVIKGFKSLKDYLEGMPWKDVPVLRLQQQPAWDEKVLKRKEPSKQRGKPIVGRGNQMKELGDKDMVSQSGPLIQKRGEEVVRAAVGEMVSVVDHATTRVTAVGVKKGIGVKETIKVAASVLDSPDDQSLEFESTDFESDEERIHCSILGVNHDWEEFACGSWVTKGNVLCDKRCIGTRNGVICERKFVDKGFGIGNKQHCSDDAFHPTVGNPAWGCKKCRRVMCSQCKTYYVTNERFQSPGRNVGVGNDRARRMNDGNVYRGNK